jgi:hypothetical protein
MPKLYQSMTDFSEMVISFSRDKLLKENNRRDSKMAARGRKQKASLL